MNPDLSVEITLVAVKDPGRKVIGQPSALPLSPAIAAGGRLFVSGMLGNTADTTGNVSAQTKLMVDRIGQTLASGGHAWSDVREAVLYVTDIATRDVVLAEMAKAFPGRWPAGLVVETALVAPDGNVELMVTASK
jgi:enamine deaminase RidA (YjgF/YER057c/UK114 family)